MSQSKRWWFMDNEIMLSFWGRIMQSHRVIDLAGVWGDAVGVWNISSSLHVYQEENLSSWFKLWSRLAEITSSRRWSLTNTKWVPHMTHENWIMRNEKFKNWVASCISFPLDLWQSHCVLLANCIDNQRQLGDTMSMKSDVGKFEL